MTKADSVHSTPRDTASKIGRRGFIGTVATALAAGATANAVVIGSTLSAPVDPIFAVIEAHKRAYEDFMAALREQWQLEADLSKKFRKSWIGGSDENIVETDDLRWIAAIRRVDITCDAERQAAADIVDVSPTSIDGLAAVLRYAIDADPDEASWPTDLVVNDDDEDSHTWHHLFIKALLTSPVLSGVQS